MIPTGPKNPYLRNKILTASPEELRLMLFDGALKYAKLARKVLDPGDPAGKLEAASGQTKPDYEQSYENISKCQKIVLELSTSMKSDAAPEIVTKLNALYTYIYRLLVDVNMERKIEPLDEAIRLLGYERETWAMLMKKNAEQQRGGPAADPPATPAPTAQQAALSAYARSA
ncbi:MAG: flagellar export chaperone FliS [Planctomycetota bacterium]